MPHTDATAAVAAVLDAGLGLPAWPQLPRRSPLEHMGVQFLEGFPGATILDGRVALTGALGPAGPPDLTAERAAGWVAFLAAVPHGPLGLKGQVTGPLTAALLAGMQDGRSVFRDLRLVRRLAHHLGRVAAYQEQELRRLNPQTLIMFDEPVLPQALADPHIGAGLAIDLLTSAAVWLRGSTGLHCCAPPPWDFLLRLPLDVISFDSYHYAGSVAAHAPAVAGYIERGGTIAWGIVPTDAAGLVTATPRGLTEQLMGAWEPLIARGLDPGAIRRGALITPSCGLASLGELAATRALQLTAAVSLHLSREIPETQSAP